jgi:hypothetical protein
VRCKLCCRFFRLCCYVFKDREDLRVIYNAKFKASSLSNRRRALIVRSHGVRHSRLTQWLITELQDLTCRKHSDFTYDVGSQERSQGADVNAVATFTQEGSPLGSRKVCPPAIYNQSPQGGTPRRGLTSSAICSIGNATYNPPTTHHTCGLVTSRTSAAKTSTVVLSIKGTANSVSVI